MAGRGGPARRLDAAAGLHYLLSTPFRYTSPIGSRFRAPAESCIWYGAEAQRTACAELGYWRWRFLMDSAALEAIGPSPQTVFRAGIDARLIDLTESPFKKSRADWTHPNDYAPTQDLARVARHIAYNRRPPRGGVNTGKDPAR